MRITEKILCILAFIGYVFLLLFWDGGAFIVSVAMLLLALFYFIFSFALLNGIRLRSIFSNQPYQGIPALHFPGAIFCGFAFSHACISFIFASLFWQGWMMFVIDSIIFLVIVLIVAAVRRKSIYAAYYRRIFTRAVALMCISVFMLLSPRKIALHLMFGNHPAFIESVENYWGNRRDKQALQHMLDERQKLHPQR